VLEARRRTLGEEHPDTLTSMGNLACIYHDLRQSTEAILLLQQSADTSQKILGEEHPDTVARNFMLSKWKNNLINNEYATK